MKRTAEVYLRAEQKRKTVPITSTDKPIVIDAIKLKWQRIVNLMAKVMDVPAGLIMQITKENMEIFLKSSNPENPYPTDGTDSLGHGLYCETVIGKDSELLVPYALDIPDWKDNPDVKLNMTSYYGLPLKWPDNEFFGTICVLDSESNDYNATFKDLLTEFKYTVERDLELLCQHDTLRHLANTDVLTNVFNRSKITQVISNEYQRSARSSAPFSVVFFDLDGFKYINDTYGHATGDQVLKTFADYINHHIRSIDAFGRWGGDEFLLICPNTDRVGVNTVIDTLKDVLLEKMTAIAPEASYSYGVGEYSPHDDDYNAVIMRADSELYQVKNNKNPNE